MLGNFFMTAVVGPVASEPLSVCGSCASCATTNLSGKVAVCAGFGPGCLCKPATRENLTAVNRRGILSPLD